MTEFLTPVRPIPRLSIGCPVWGCDRWRGSLYTAKATRDDFLAQYSAAFHTVEVNSSFYALPVPEIVEGWAQRTQPGFQFCLKFPKALTHDALLVGAEGVTRAFIHLLRILEQHDRLGPAFLQLPPEFGIRHFTALARFLNAWPADLPIAVEVRHADYFDGDVHEQRLNDLLQGRGIDRCLFDSRALFSAPPTDEAERESQRRKPRSPYRTTVTAGRPMVRFVGRNDVSQVTPWIAEWAGTLAGWMGQGLRPIIFTHSPDDACAPEFARKVWQAIREQVPDLEPLPAWAGESERSQRKTQRTLFS
jgi:uncharacterized protein YecE (DUF72 family)